MRIHENHHRSLAKATSYTIAVILADVFVIAAITREAHVAFEVILATNLASLAIYYVHARVWNRIHWGRTIRR
jgi:uncharacterized membrane protein